MSYDLAPYSMANEPTYANTEQIEIQPAKSITREMFGSSIKLIENSLLLVHPKYSFFLAGISMCTEGDKNDEYWFGVKEGLGLLLIISSPIIGVCKVGAAAAGAGIGALSTIATGPIYLMNVCKNMIYGGGEEEKIAAIKLNLASLFACRVKAMIDEATIAPGLKLFFKSNPKEFVVLAVINLAFNSMNMPPGKIMMINEQPVDREDIMGLGTDFVDYFEAIRTLADLIAELDIFLDEPQPQHWNQLMYSLNSLSRRDLDSLGYRDAINLNTISTEAHRLAEVICNDPLFTQNYYGPI